MNKLMIVLFLFPVLTQAQLKVVCEARERILHPGCKDTTSRNLFEAKYRENDVATAAVRANLDSQIWFKVGAVKETKYLSAGISRNGGPAMLNMASAGRAASQEDDSVYVSYSEGRSENSGNCDDKIFEMVCLLADENASLTSPVLKSKLNDSFTASK